MKLIRFSSFSRFVLPIAAASAFATSAFSANHSPLDAASCKEPAPCCMQDSVAGSDSFFSSLRGQVDPADFNLYVSRSGEENPEASRLVAICYLTGTGVGKDLRKAWEWYGKAAKEGDNEAQYEIGVLYRDGIGTPASMKEAAYWFRKAGRNGHPTALVNIARQFANGQGVLQDYRVAAQYYWQAAEHGSIEGAYYFAKMLKEGTGVDRDLKRALKYFRIAAQHNFRDSKKQVADLSTRR